MAPCGAQRLLWSRAACVIPSSVEGKYHRPGRLIVQEGCRREGLSPVVAWHFMAETDGERKQAYSSSFFSRVTTDPMSKIATA